MQACLICSRRTFCQVHPLVLSWLIKSVRLAILVLSQLLRVWLIRWTLKWLQIRDLLLTSRSR
ncbi:unnamed protein product [Prunus brigantina]